MWPKLFVQLYFESTAVYSPLSLFSLVLLCFSLVLLFHFLSQALNFYRSSGCFFEFLHRVPTYIFKIKFSCKFILAIPFYCYILVSFRFMVFRIHMLFTSLRGYRPRGVFDTERKYFSVCMYGPTRTVNKFNCKLIILLIL